MVSDVNNRIWHLQNPDEDLVYRLVHKAGLSDIMARLLANRGVQTETEARNFLKPSLRNLLPFDSLPDINIAVDRIIKAIKDRETIVIYGDYDADGVTATAVLVSFLRSVGATVKTYQPHRIREGYGLKVDALQDLYEQGARLVVVVDLGITDSEEVDWASSRGMEIIVVDHHHIPERLPKALALLDPLTKEEAAPFHHLTGVGLAFYLMLGLRARLRDEGFFGEKKEPDLRHYLDLVAIGTIADLMPLTGLNRILVAYGLKELGAERRPGVKALKAVSRLNRKRVTAGQVAFQLAPRLNAAGRMDDAAIAVSLLVAEDAAEAEKLARKLEKFNQERQQVEARILEEAVRIIEKEQPLQSSYGLVLAGENWHPGVIGIVASRIVDTYSLPTAVVSMDGDKGKGSMRSVRGIDAWKALDDCKDCLIGYGGHEMAGGFVVARDMIETFRERFNEAVKAQVAKSDVAMESEGRKLLIDMEMELEDIDTALMQQMAQLAPHGVGNPEPLFLARAVSCESVRVVGTNHLKFQVYCKSAESRGKRGMDAIAFGMADRIEQLKAPVDLAFTPTISEWENWERVEIKVKDFRKHK